MIISILRIYMFFLIIFTKSFSLNYNLKYYFLETNLIYMIRNKVLFFKPLQNFNNFLEINKTINKHKVKILKKRI